MYRKIHRNEVGYSDARTIAPINRGGTNAENATGAVTNLGGILRSARGVPNGIATYDITSRIPQQQINIASIGYVDTVKGDKSINPSQVKTYTITNYDSHRTYTITALSGTVSRSVDVITYTAPADTNVQYGFTINGRIININRT